MAPTPPLKCPHFGGNELYTRRVAAGRQKSIYLLPGLGDLFYYARLHVVICGTCGHCSFFAEQDALPKLRQGNGWTPLQPTGDADRASQVR